MFTSTKESPIIPTPFVQNSKQSDVQSASDRIGHGDNPTTTTHDHSYDSTKNIQFPSKIQDNLSDASPSSPPSSSPYFIVNDFKKTIHAQYGKWIIFGLSLFLIVETSLSMIYCMNIKADQEFEMSELRESVQILKEQLAILNATTNELLRNSSLPVMMQEIFIVLEDKMDEKIHNSFLEVNGSRCRSIARNCALDMISLVPGSIIYSGISKCGSFVGL